MLHVACCMLHVACCIWRVARCMLHVACCIWRVARCMLHVACCMWRVARCLLHVACCPLHVARCVLGVICRPTVPWACTAMLDMHARQGYIDQLFHMHVWPRCRPNALVLRPLAKLRRLRVPPVHNNTPNQPSGCLAIHLASAAREPHSKSPVWRRTFV